MLLDRQYTGPDYFVIKNPPEDLIPKILAMGFTLHKYHHLNTYKVGYRLKYEELPYSEDFCARLYQFVLDNGGTFSNKAPFNGFSVKDHFQMLVAKGVVVQTVTL